MAKLVELIKSASASLLDPNRQQRIESLVREVEALISKERGNFNFEHAAESLGMERRDDKAVSGLVYERALRKTWRDLVITKRERGALNWLSEALRLDPGDVRRIETRVGREHFEQYFAKAIADGEIDKQEAQTLSGIAASMGTDLRTLVHQYFSKEAAGLLRGLFLAAIEDGHLDDAEWSRLIRAAEALGLNEHDLVQSVRPQAHDFIERVLAEAKADEQITDDEHSYLVRLIDWLKPSDKVSRYVRGEIDELRLLTQIRRGQLPSLTEVGVMLRGGEIAHFEGPVRFIQTRNLARGPRVDEHTGTLIITDARLIFASSTAPFDMSLRRVLQVSRQRNGFELQASRRASGLYVFPDSRFPVAIFEAAVMRANQTLLALTEGLPTRHIPRDVRQRVWQKYGGRCADCGANDYLEYDHIIPVAKGEAAAMARITCNCCVADAT